MSQKFLSRADILGADDLPSEVVPVPEWGGDVRVTGLTAKDRAQYESGFTKEVRGKAGEIEYRQNRPALMQLRERLVAYTVVDQNGARLFSDTDIADLGKKSAAALQRVFEVAQRLSGMSKQDIEELEKNLDETDEDSSSSVSPVSLVAAQ